MNTKGTSTAFPRLLLLVAVGTFFTLSGQYLWKSNFQQSRDEVHLDVQQTTESLSLGLLLTTTGLGLDFLPTTKRTRLDLEQSIEDTKLEHWLPDWYNQSDTGFLLAHRMKTVKTRCQSFEGHRNVWHHKLQAPTTHTKRLQYCQTNKAGSTFWKRLLKVSQTMGKPISNNHVARKKVTTMRNPWHRLVSLYTHQIEATSGSHNNLKVRRFCHKLFDEKPNFRQFVHSCIIANWKNHTTDEHWIPTAEKCNICSGQFDYIVAAENMAKESSYVLKQAGITNSAKIVDYTRKKSIRKNEKRKMSANYQSYYIDMDIEDIQTLQRIYEFDCYVLQYPTTPFVDFENS